MTELKNLCDFLQGRCDVAQVGKNEARIQMRVSDVRTLVAAARAPLEATEALDRLVTVIDEEFGLQPVAESPDELVGSLERLLYKRRQQARATRTPAFSPPSAPSQPAESMAVWVAALELECGAAVLARSEMCSCAPGSLAWINAAETVADHVEELGRILSNKVPTNGR